MNFGLSAQDIGLIKGVLENHPEITSVKIFGSRAMGNYRANSDIDMALWGDIGFDNLSSIKDDLESLPLPYKFDVVDYEAITHLPFKDHIDEHGRDFYINDVIQ